MSTCKPSWVCTVIYTVKTVGKLPACIVFDLLVTVQRIKHAYTACG